MQIPLRIGATEASFTEGFTKTRTTATAICRPEEPPSRVSYAVTGGSGYAGTCGLDGTFTLGCTVTFTY